MGQDTWTQPTNMKDQLRTMTKRLDSLELREGAVSTILSITGPAQNARAILISDWNDETTSNNGYFWSHIGSLHSPDPLLPWTGSVIGRSDNSGMQEVWNTDDLNNVKYFMRTYTDDGTGQGRIYSSWRGFPTPTGLIELTDLGETVQDHLNELADAIDGVAQAINVYSQTTPPTDPDSLGRDLVKGDTWFDTDDNNKPYVWDGDSWEDIAGAWWDAALIDIAAAQAAAEAAANAAEDAMDFAVTNTKAYRQTAAPTNPDSNGRTLVVADQWFDTDDNSRMYSWNGSTWVDLDWATETYAASQAAAAQTAAIAAAAADATTKASAAQAAAISAAAADATTKAAAAQAAATAVANTKVFVFRQGTTPTSLAAGDLWYDTANDNRIYRAFAAGVNTIGSSAWVLTQIGQTAIADDSITSAKIVANTIQTGDLVATAIDGMTVTGATLQTIVTAARGIKLNSTGLTAYNGSGTPTLTITAATGAISMLGDLTSGSTVTGAVVTGGTLQTEATAARGIKMSTGGLIAYNTSGVAQFTVNATTGAVTLTGPLTGAGTITGPTLQTSASATTGIKITSSGLTAYNGSGTPTITINATTGAVSLVGALTSGSTIDGAVVTGGTVQTEATAARGIKMSSTGMVAYDGSGTPTFTITAATGAITLAGSLTGAGVISGPTLRGGVWETTATANAGIKVSSTGLVAYNGSGVASVVIDALSGVLTSAGGVLSGGSITGAVVTGSVLQTSAAPSVGIKINSAGFVAYDNTLNATVVIDAITGAVDLRGKLTSTSLSSLDNLAIAGTNNFVQGTLYAQATIAAPKVAPTLALGWNTVAVIGTTPAPVVGLCKHPTDSNLLVGIRGVTAEKTLLVEINKTTGVATDIPQSTAVFNFDLDGGVEVLGLTSLGTDYFALTRASSQNQYRLYKATTNTTPSTWVAVASVVSGPTQFFGTPTIGRDESTGTPAILICGRITGGTMQRRTWNSSLASVSSVNISTTDIPAVPLMVGCYSGAADLGTTDRLIITAVPSTGTQQGVNYVQQNNGTRVSANDFPTPEYCRALCWDVGPTGDSNNYFWCVDLFGSVVRYALNTADEFIKIGHSWYDGNATGSLHETNVDNAGTTTIQRKARQLLTVVTPVAPESGSALTNAANQAGLYAMTAANLSAAAALATTALKLQDQAKVYGSAAQDAGYSGVTGANATVTTWTIQEPIKTTGTAPQTVNGFLSLASVGQFQSFDFTAAVAGWQLKGDGTAQIGRYTWDKTSGRRTDTQAPAASVAGSLLTGTVLPNGGSGVLSPHSATIAAGKSLGYIKGYLSAQATGNQQVSWVLQYSFDGSTFNDCDAIGLHNNGNAVFNLGGAMAAFVDIPTTATTMWVRIRYVVAGGGFNVTIGMCNYSIQFLA